MRWTDYHILVEIEMHNNNEMEKHNEAMHILMACYFLGDALKFSIGHGNKSWLSVLFFLLCAT